jgi:hypothetical protein
MHLAAAAMHLATAARMTSSSSSSSAAMAAAFVLGQCWSRRQSQVGQAQHGQDDDQFPDFHWSFSC